jgi:hypothetical protein
MRIVISKPDNLVGIDEVFEPVFLTKLPEDIRIIQWYGDKGHIEYFNTTVEDITDFTPFDYLITAHQLTIDHTYALTLNTAEAFYEAVKSDIESLFIESPQGSVNLILSEEWVGLTLSERFRKSDGLSIGITIDLLSKGPDSSGSEGLRTIKRLFERATTLSVCIFADLFPVGIDKEQLSGYLESLGSLVLRRPVENFMYFGVTPTWLEMQK